MRIFLSTASSFVSKICSLALKDKFSLTVVQDTRLSSMMELALYSDCLLLDYEAFTFEDVEELLNFSNRSTRCRVILLMDRELIEELGTVYEGRAACLDIFSPPDLFVRAVQKTASAGAGYIVPGYIRKEEKGLLISNGCPSHAPMLHGLRDPFSRYQRQSFYDRLKIAAESDADILLVGESGSGKTYLAEQIYRRSGRKGNFLIESLANLSPSIFESELFGSVAGAYTGSVNKMGLLEAAGKGTLFLDEIAELPLHLQSKLFSTLDRRSFRRLGSVKELPFEGRLIFATNRDLKAAVRDGTFREELYNRISMVTLYVPPLRERSGEIGPLAVSFAEKEGRSLSAAALEKLHHYSYPGNIRELKNIIRRSCLFCRRASLGAGDIIIGQS